MVYSLFFFKIVLLQETKYRMKYSSVKNLTTRPQREILERLRFYTKIKINKYEFFHTLLPYFVDQYDFNGYISNFNFLCPYEL